MPLAKFLLNWEQDELWLLFASCGDVCQKALLQHGRRKFQSDVLEAKLPVLKGKSKKKSRRLDPELTAELAKASPAESSRLQRALKIRLARQGIRRRRQGTETGYYIASSRKYVRRFSKAPSCWLSVDEGTVGQQSTLFGVAEIEGAEGHTVFMAPQVPYMQPVMVFCLQHNGVLECSPIACEVTRALVRRNELIEAPPEQDRAEWQQALAEFFRGAQAAEEKSKARKPGRDRVPACHFMHCLSNALAVSFGMRLSDYYPKPEVVQEGPKRKRKRAYPKWAGENPDLCEADLTDLSEGQLAAESKDGSSNAEQAEQLQAAAPSLSNCLVLCVDEGSVGYAAIWFLLNHLKMRLIAQRDPIHRGVNDWKLAVKSASGNLWNMITSTVLVFNLAHGPWGSGRWFEVAQESAALLHQREDVNCPLWRFLLRKTPGGAREIEQAWQNKGDKVSLTRWYSWVSAANSQLGHWWARLCCLLVGGLEHLAQPVKHTLHFFLGTSGDTKSIFLHCKKIRLGYFKNAQDFQAFVNDQAGACRWNAVVVFHFWPAGPRCRTLMRLVAQMQLLAQARSGPPQVWRMQMSAESKEARRTTFIRCAPLWPTRQLIRRSAAKPQVMKSFH